MPVASTPTTMDAFAQIFQQFAAGECKGYSPLYEQLAMGLAADEELLRLAAQAPPGQPVPNLLLGAVHYLLYQQPATPLARYYPSLTPAPLPAQGAYPYFRGFCLARQAEIIGLLHTRRVQTNEVRRFACLMPAFCRVAELAGDLPLALVEIGARHARRFSSRTPALFHAQVVTLKGILCTNSPNNSVTNMPASSRMPVWWRPILNARPTLPKRLKSWRG